MNTYVQKIKLFKETYALVLFFVLSTSAHSLDNNTENLLGSNLSEKPNILFLLFDDAGYSDSSAFGSEISTPNIERIAREGITIPKFYTAARCSPTRAGILTGLHPHKVGMADLSGKNFKTEYKAYQGQLPPDAPLLSELLQANGYRTFMSGKWHLGSVPNRTKKQGYVAPNERGFDEFIGILEGEAHPYPTDAKHRKRYIHNNLKIKPEKGWYSLTGLNNILLKELNELFSDKPDTPFFAFLTTQAPHDPTAAPKHLVDKYSKIYSDQTIEELWESRVHNMKNAGILPFHTPTTPPKIKKHHRQKIIDNMVLHSAMMEAADIEFGRVLDLVEEYGKLENTIIIVASDNGAPDGRDKLASAPYNGAKALLYEGGLLSPLSIRWPAGGVAEGMISQSISSYLDIMPTLLALTKTQYTPISKNDFSAGRDISHILAGENMAPPEYMFWDLYGQSSIIHDGKWKLIINGGWYDRETADIRELELFYLPLDPTEKWNLSSIFRNKASQLEEKFDEWGQKNGAVPFKFIEDAYQDIRTKKNNISRNYLIEATPH